MKMLLLMLFSGNELLLLLRLLKNDLMQVVCAAAHGHGVVYRVQVEVHCPQQQLTNNFCSLVPRVRHQED